MSYTQLSTTERFKLYQYRTTDKLTMSEIATQMKRSKSTISRAIKRNSIDAKLYLPDTAQTQMQTRRAQSKQKFMSISESTIEQVKQRLEQYHSPEQLSGRMKHEGLNAISSAISQTRQKEAKTV
jgi:transposase, IS30 family